MYLFEAMRLGSSLVPQGFNAFIHYHLRTDDYWEADSACALGAATLAFAGSRVYEHHCDVPSVLILWKTFLFDVRPPACPACGKNYLVSFKELIVHLNDKEHWTRERIADFIEPYERAVVLVEPEREIEFEFEGV